MFSNGAIHEPQHQSHTALMTDGSVKPVSSQLASRTRAVLSSAQERIAELSAGAQLELWRQYHDHQLKMAREQQEQQLKFLIEGQKRTGDTFQTIFVQTKWAGCVSWVTFLFGVLLMAISVGAVLLRPEFSKSPLIAGFFGTGFLSMLASLRRDPADKIQRDGSKLMKLQVAMNYNLLETQLWGGYFADRKAEGKDVRADELSGALAQMRDGMHAIMNHIDEAMEGRLEKADGARSRSQASSAPVKKKAVPHAIQS